MTLRHVLGGSPDFTNVANLKREFQTLLKACLIYANFRMIVLNEICLKFLVGYGDGIFFVLRKQIKVFTKAP